MSNSPRFLLDENVRTEIKEFLESRGFSVEYVTKGISNSKLALCAKEKNLVLLTRDIDFLNTSLFSPVESSGILVFRIHPPEPEKLVNTLSSLLARVEEFKGKLFVVEEKGFKVVE